MTVPVTPTSDDSRRHIDAADPLPEERLEALAMRLRLLGDPTRIRLIQRLNGSGAASVGALAAGLPLTRQGVSRQLGLLHQAGIVRRRREGMCVLYELADWTGLWLLEQLADALVAEP